jgi:serine/threonine-protein kinase
LFVAEARAAIMHITLTVTAGPHQGQVFQFTGHDTFIVGRSKRAHFRLPAKDRYFSRVHFLVEVNPPQCRLMDLGSRNGTYVNGQKVKTADLQDGDQIRAGQTVLHVAVADREALPSAVPEPGPAPASPATSSPSSTLQPQAVPVPSAPDPPLPRATLQPSRGPVERPPVRESCRVCGALLGVTEGAAPPPSPSASMGEDEFSSSLASVTGGRSKGDPTAAVQLLLCPDCREQIDRHPQPIAGYQIVRELGQGGMGVVYLALRTADSRLVALKTVIPAAAGSKGQIERFLREANILRELDHPNIVTFRDLGESRGQLYFAMDYVRGTDTGQILKSHGPLPIDRALGFICQLLQALAYAHGRGFVHRDIKPANLLVTQEGGREVVKLADFGLARVYHTSQLSGLTLTGATGGTVAFMAPEQVTRFREAQPAADQYAAAASLYNLLTDRFVYDLPRSLQEQFTMILLDDPVPIRKRRPEIPAGLAAVLHRALAREPVARYPDVGALRQAVLPYCA